MLPHYTLATLLTQVYALDGWDTPASTVSWLVSQGAYPVCYFRCVCV
jgi:hypothetical protein